MANLVGHIAKIGTKKWGDHTSTTTRSYSTPTKKPFLVALGIRKSHCSFHVSGT